MLGLIFYKSDLQLACESYSHIKHIAAGAIGDANRSVEMETFGIYLVELGIGQDCLREELGRHLAVKKTLPDIP